jgi:formiminotetrahydrofolate cyclodeaminase
MSESYSAWTIKGLCSQVAAADQFAGGGAVASMSLAGAAATAELVFTLSARRKKISDEDRLRLNNAVALCHQLQKVFQHAIDEDMAALNELMDAQSRLRSARRDGATPDAEVVKRAREAVDTAIETPLQIARDGRRLLRTIDELQQLARPFTASDLGAAAATCLGAITSLVLMAEVNLSLVEEEKTAERIAQEIDDLYSQSREQADNVVANTRSVIR